MPTIIEAAKQVRQALKRAFPRYKISVTSGSGVDVAWTDQGPELKAVKDALIAAKCATAHYNGGGHLRTAGGGYSISFDRYNAAAREAGWHTTSATFVARFADGELTKMTTHTALQRLDVKRGVRLAQHAYRSRTGREPPTIAEASFEINGTTLATYDAAALEKRCAP